MEQTFLNSCRLKEGQYLIGDFIGQGAYGIVYHCTLNQCHITMKQLKPFQSEDDVRTFQSEIKILATLNHPGCLRLIGFELPNITIEKGVKIYPEASHTEKGDELPKEWGARIFTPYFPKNTMSNFLMNYVNGAKKSLKYFNTILMISFYGIIRSLKYLHSKSIAHFDIKPENVLFNSFGYPVLADFGLSVYSANETVTGIRGSLLFMAPEVLLAAENGKPLIGEEQLKADIYSYGMLLYECFNLNPTYSSHDDLLLIPGYTSSYHFPIVTNENFKDCRRNGYLPEKIDEIPDGLWDEVIVRCLDKDPNKRLTADQITEIFENQLDEIALDDLDFILFEQYQSYIETEEAKIKIPRRRWHLYHPEQDKKYKQ